MRNSGRAMRLHCSMCAVLLSATAHAQVHVLTYHNDLARTAQNLSETVLTRADVASDGFGKLSTLPVDGQVYAQPLYVSGLKVAGAAHNVVFAATEHDSVYAFDADSGGEPLWRVSFLSAGVTTVPSSNTGCGQITPEIGITGTPVIDLMAGTLYVVAMTLENGTYAHRFHALDIASGAERPGSPVLIQATVPGTGEGGSTLTFKAKDYKERPGLLLLNGVVYTAWSSHCDIGKYHGWLMGYDAKTLQQVSVYNNTPNGNEGSFWAGGAAPAADAQGNIYLIAGNGTFDADRGGPDLGEAFIKLSTKGTLALSDWFAPFNAAVLNSRDLDIGSSGALLLPEEVGSAAHPHLLVSAGKEGRIYLVDRDSMGRFQAADDSQISQSIVGAISPLFGIPAYFQGAVYFGGSGDSLKAFPIQNGQLSAGPSSQSAAKFGFPGSVPSISANGTADGIVWVLEPTGNGRLHAYDSRDLSKELFASNNKATNALGSYVKFSTPTVVNGHVYAGTQNSVVVYGLSTSGVTSVAAVVNAASFEAGAVAPGSLVAIFGQFPAAATVQVNGIPAPVLYSGTTQINAQIPYETAPGTATLTVASAEPVPFMVQATAPGLFTIGGNQAAVLNGPARAGTILSAYLTGQGSVSPTVATGQAAPATPLSQVQAKVSATVGGQPAAVMFAGLSPGLVGVFQVNFEVPQLAPGTYPLQIQVGSVLSNEASVSVGQ